MARLSRSSPTCARAARVSLAAFLDVVVIADPVQYQRHRDERDDVSMPLRSLHFGPDGGGLVRFLVYPPDDLVLKIAEKTSLPRAPRFGHAAARLTTQNSGRDAYRCPGAHIFPVREIRLAR